MKMELCRAGRSIPKLRKVKRARKMQAAACCGCSGGCSPCVLRHFRGAAVARPFSDVDILGDDDVCVFFFPDSL